MRVLEHLVAREYTPGRWALWNRAMNRWVGLSTPPATFDTKQQCLEFNSGPFGKPSND
jgi:hypothetical protein